MRKQSDGDVVMEVLFVQMLFLFLVISTFAGFWWLICDYNKEYGWRSAEYDDNFRLRDSDESNRAKKKHKTESD